MIRKSRITIKSLNTLHSVPAIEFELLISDLEHFALKRGPALQFIINDVVEFIGCLKRQSECINDLLPLS